ncbi:hypothetical protein [Virgibacillus dokdonensis]|nr:hypothetical protein [Virgibacillus dokdonensis]
MNNAPEHVQEKILMFFALHSAPIIIKRRRKEKEETNKFITSGKRKA